MPFNLIITDITSAGILVWLLQQVKHLPWVQNLPHWAYRAFSVLWALATTFIVARLTGQHLTFEHTELMELLIDLWNWLGQFIIQEVLYRITSRQAQ